MVILFFLMSHQTSSLVRSTSLCYGGKLTPLITLNNCLFGPIPESLGECVSLVRIRMGHNYLNGSIPKDNYLTGNLTDSSKDYENLGQLNLSNSKRGREIEREMVEIWREKERHFGRIT
ncbi:hypothetical protein AMTRI_Chr06g177200 [Amborella trichopoda]